MAGPGGSVAGLLQPPVVVVHFVVMDAICILGTHNIAIVRVRVNCKGRSR